MTYGPGDISGSPPGLVVQIGQGATGAVIWTDVSLYIKRESVVITRHKPGEPGRMTFEIWAQNGNFPFITPLRDMCRVRAYDPYTNPTGIWTRYFAGWAITTRLRVENNINLYISLDCADYNWLWHNPPAMPQIKTLIGAAPVWLPDHQYFAGDEVQPLPSNGHKYTASVGGNSLHDIPAFPIGAGATVNELMPTVWAANTAYHVGDEVRPTSTANTHRFVVYAITGDGKSGGTQPTWVTTPGATTPDNHVTWHENGSNGVRWTESGSSNVTDVTTINQMLDLYFPYEFTHHSRPGIKNLIASVPSVEMDVTDTPHDVLNKIAENVTSTKYYENPDAWVQNHAYSVNDFLFQPETVGSSNGIVFRCTVAGTSHNTSTPPPFTTVVDLGAVVADGGGSPVMWISDHRLGRARPNTVYVVGQRIEPQTGTSTGRWYHCITAGVAGPTATWGIWPSAVGAPISIGAGGTPPTFVCGGSTDAAPVWEWRVPSDNITHDATWDPEAWWIDSNSDGDDGILLHVVQYTDITDLTGLPTKLHYTDLTMNREGNGYANVYYVFGKNGSFARVVNAAEILNKGGLTVAKAFVDTGDTGPPDNNACYAKGTELLAIAQYSETGQLTAYDPLDPVMLQQMTQLRIKNDLFGIDPGPTEYTTYPVSDAQVSFTDQVPEYAFTIGAPFLTDRESLTAKRRGGRVMPTQGAPPRVIQWLSDWVMMNVPRPLTLTASVQVQWRSAGEANMSYFNVQADVNGVRRWLPRVMYPTQYIHVDDLPLGAEIYFYVLPVNNQGTWPVDELGNPRYTRSPLLNTPPLPTRPDPPGFVSAISGYTDPPFLNYFADVTVSSPPPNDHSRGGYVTLTLADSLRVLQEVDIPGDATYPYTAHFDNIEPFVLYDFHAAVQDAYQQWSNVNVLEDWNVTPLMPPNAPGFVSLTPGIEGGEQITAFYLDVEVDQSAAPPLTGDTSGGGYVSIYVHGSPHLLQTIQISGGADYPATVRFHNLTPDAYYDIKAAVFDGYNRRSAEGVYTNYHFVGPIIPQPPTLIETSDVYNDIDDLTQIAFAWTAPTPPTGLTIAGYRVVKSQDGITTPIDVGLTLAVNLFFMPTSTYTLTVQAIDNFGHAGAGRSITGSPAGRVYDVLHNPSFENIERIPTPLNPRGWTLLNNNGSILWDDTNSSVGGRSLRFHFTSGASGPTAQSDFFRLTELTKYWHTVDAKAASAGGVINFIIRYYGAGFGSPLATKSTSITGIGTSWATYTVDIGYDPPAPPAGTRYCRITYSLAAPNPDVWIDNLSFARQVPTVGLQDNSITPTKLGPTGMSTPTDGMVLTANAASAPTGMNWQTPSTTDAGAIHATIVDAKGDLIAGTANDAVARLPVGGAGKALKPDSSAATGLKWEQIDFAELTGTLGVGQHGAQGGGTQHTVASGIAAGFMSTTDKGNLDTVVANYVSKGLIDNKGDILAGLANDSIGRLGSGTDGQSLHAKSAATTGLQWAADGVVVLTNKSGGSVALGDVVILHSLITGTFTTINVAGFTPCIIGVVQETIANDAAGLVMLFGYTPQINLNFTGAATDLITTSATVKLAAKATSWALSIGIFGQLWGAGTSPPAVIWANPSRAPQQHGPTHDPTVGGDIIPDLDRGTSYPGSPTTNRRYFNTTQGAQPFWNGTYWLGPEVTIPLVNYQGTQPYSGNTEAYACAAFSDYRMLITRFELGFHVFTTNNASNYWKAHFRRLTSGVSWIDVGVADTLSAGNDTWKHAPAVTSFTNNPTATDDILWQVYVDKNGSPGTPGNAFLVPIVKGRFIYG